MSAEPPPATSTPSSPRGLEVRTTGDHAHGVVSVIGEIDMATVDEFAAAVRAVLSAPGRSLVLDLGACEFLDSCGLGVILEAHRTLVDDASRDLTILPGPPHVQRLFEVTGTLAVLPFV